MLLWSSDSQKRASMEKLCRAFGIAGKGDMDGSKVAETWLTDPEKVIHYCKKDVVRTREIYRRLTWA
jgi:predicted PolB exonuclease-like 3'-5' exonuclease